MTNPPKSPIRGKPPFLNRLPKVTFMVVMMAAPLEMRLPLAHIPNLDPKSPHSSITYLVAPSLLSLMAKMEFLWPSCVR